MLSMLLLAGSTIVAGNCSAVWGVTQEGAKMPSRYELKFDLTCSGNGAAGGAPAAGYAAWFDAGESIYKDVGGTVPAVADGDVVLRWDSKGGGYGALACTVPGGYGAPTLKTGGNGINSRPIVRSLAATFELLRDNALSLTIFEGGILNVAQGTAIAVVKKSAGTGTIWGDHSGYLNAGYIAGPNLRSYLFDVGAKNADKAAAYSVPQIHTWHHAGGSLYSGVNDTRTASMATVAAANMDAAAGFLVLIGGSGPGVYLDGDLAELIFYPTALSEADRKITEMYLASKYGITLPY